MTRTTPATKLESSSPDPTVIHQPKSTRAPLSDGPPTEAIALSDPKEAPPRLEDILVGLCAETVDSLEQARLQTENRIRALRQVRGVDDAPELARLHGLVDGLRSLEDGAVLELKRVVRKHPLGKWIRSTVGLGEKQVGRLLAAIGDPGSRDTVSQLWAYCGLHVINPDHRSIDTQKSSIGESGGEAQKGNGNQRSPGLAPRRIRGQRANWNTDAKTRAYLVAESCMKQRTSPYRAVYDAGRAKYAEAVHAHPCPQCGPKGKPAQPGSPLSAGHQHARAIRLVMKAILRDLWIQSQSDSQPIADAITKRAAFGRFTALDPEQLAGVPS